LRVQNNYILYYADSGHRSLDEALGIISAHSLDTSKILYRYSRRRVNELRGDEQSCRSSKNNINVLLRDQKLKNNNNVEVIDRHPGT